MIKWLSLTTFCLSLIACQSQVRNDQRIDHILSDNNDFSGSVLVAKNGSIIYSKAVGFSDESARKIATTDTRYNICSIGKMLTASLVLKAVEQRKISLNDSLEKYLPGKFPNGNKIQVRHLLSHTSGLGNYMNHPEYQRKLSRTASIDDLMMLVETTPSVFNDPGSDFRYSNSGFIVLGKILELVETKTYQEILQERILDPLEMESATLVPNLADIRGFAKPYVRQATDNEWASKIFAIPPPSSDGGLYCTPEDFLKFDQALYSGKLITKSSLDSMRRIVSDSGFPYGFGMMITDAGEYKAFGHSGGIPGYNSEYRHYSIGNNEYTLIIFGNHDRTVRPVFLAIQDLIVQKQF